MCGIYLSNLPFTEENVKEKLKSINFRGPDFLGVLKLNNLIFGHLRLSIVDLDVRSNQPMQFENLTIVFNGEIYNFIEIKNELINLGYSFNTTGDTEVILKGYKAWGKEIVPKLNGMFAFAIYDSFDNKIFCSRDRLGVKPFYYYLKDGNFEICSQLRPLSKEKIINEDSVSMFLECSYIPSPYTIFKDVYKLSPGNNLLIDLDDFSVTISEYWNLKNVEESNLTYDEAKEKLHILIKDAVRIRLQSDVPFGSFLSGGIDSALVSSIASKISDYPIKTFSIGFDVKEYDESQIAAKYAEIIGSRHTETICSVDEVKQMIPKFIKAYDEPFADSSALPSLLLNKVTKDHVTMAISGDGGDESFLGYNYFEGILLFDKVLKIPYFFRKILSFFLIPKIFNNRFENYKNLLKIPTINEYIRNVFVGGSSSLLKKQDFNWMDRYNDYKFKSTNPLQKAADLNIKLWLENDSNVKVDRASMAFSVEVRSPFLDYRIIEFARNLPISYRFVSGKRKRILRDILKEYIPEEVFDQPKKGFGVPIGKWIREDMKNEFEENLKDDFLELVPNLDIKKFKRIYKLHMKDKVDYSAYIWRVYVLSKWYQEFGFYKKNN
jgi:asparagine synthase (glutamine-hydrolysing)